MATFYLNRHGHNDWLGKGLAGRLPGVRLSERGRAEAEALAEWLAGRGIRRIISSPLERARETAAPLARRTGLAVELSEEILEVDFGDWNGALLEDLNRDERWRLFNTYRSGTRIPNGELIGEIQARMARALERWSREEPDGVFALFSHGDPIRAALCYYLGMPLDMLTRLEVSPGSASMVRLNPWGPEVLGINIIPDPSAAPGKK